MGTFRVLQYVTSLKWWRLRKLNESNADAFILAGRLLQSSSSSRVQMALIVHLGSSLPCLITWKHATLLPILPPPSTAHLPIRTPDSGFSLCGNQALTITCQNDSLLDHSMLTDFRGKISLFPGMGILYTLTVN